MKLPHAVAAASVALVAGIGLTSCDALNSVARPTSPVVVTGAELPGLIGTAPDDIVAFRHVRLGSETPRWEQVPVQVDERKVVGFGSAPSSNTTAGVTGTVYGSGSPGVTALQYADPDTFVGADTDPAFDSDDELVFMASDGGARAHPGSASEPSGVVAGTGVAVEVTDPLGTDEQGWVYLFRSTALDPGAGRDYVDYDFELASGSYKTTYKRADGPNPETSRVTTDRYEIRFSDRWIEDSWKVKSPGASGVDILDGHKNQFAVNFCGRSNVTFADAEGAFVANIDGPVRAIRSYVGANSGPLTQRTHLMYRDRQDVITDLRVHAIPAVMDFIDHSSAAQGMTYRSSTVPGGVTIDGVDDPVPTAVPTWESVDGPQGQVLTRSTFDSSADVTAQMFYRDQTTPPEEQCWGDDSFLGASGAGVTSSIPNTDPRTNPFDTLRSERVTQFGPPATDPTSIAAQAASWAQDLDAPLVVATSPFQP